jgi:hypothetical protein
MVNFKIIGASVVALGLSLTSSFAATLNVVGGELVGASNVGVSGTLYDVAFVDGTCVAIFGGCDDTSDFAFNTQALAEAASEALITDVLLDGPLGNFDSDASLVAGVSAGFTFPTLIVTPFGLNAGGSVEAFLARNLDSVDNSVFGDRTLLEANPQNPNQDFTIEQTRVWAVWSAVGVVDPVDPDSMAPVRLPAGGVLLLTGLAAAAGLKRKKKAAA